MSNTATLTENTIRGVEDLRAVNRCDNSSCGAAAATVVTLANGGQLLFCGHHTNEHRARLLEDGAKLDEALALQP